MKEVFKEMKNVGKQNAVELKSYEIERKNILITNENLIARCIAQDVFYTATDSALTACQFHDLSNALSVTQNRVIELERENLELLEKIQNDDHDNMVRHLSKLEVDNLNLQLKHQHLEQRNKTSNAKTSLDAPEFDAYFEISKRDEKSQAHMNTIRKLKSQIAQLKSHKSDVIGTQNPQSLDSQNFQFQDIINKLQYENDCFQAKNSNIKMLYKGLYDSIKVTHDKHNEKITSLNKETENLKTQVKGKMPVITSDNIAPKVSASRK